MRPRRRGLDAKYADDADYEGEPDDRAFRLRESDYAAGHEGLSVFILPGILTCPIM